MALRFVGKDPNSSNGDCPSIWIDEETKDFVVQGWEVIDQPTREEIASQSPIAADERVVRLPARMRELLLAACEGSASGV